MSEFHSGEVDQIMEELETPDFHGFWECVIEAVQALIADRESRDSD